MNRINFLPSVMHRSFVIFFVTIILALNVPKTHAARWYHVEVLVFKNTAEFSNGEDWSVPERTPNFATAIDLNHLSGVDGTIVPLSNSAFYLSGVYERLNISSKYKPVLHRAWAQPGYSANNVRSVYVSKGDFSNQDLSDDGGLEIEGPTIEGTIGLQGGRLLHVNMNFVLRDADITTTISEFRRIKLKQLHYFDHPLFGVLFRVIPYKVDPTE